MGDDAIAFLRLSPRCIAGCPARANTSVPIATRPHNTRANHARALSLPVRVRGTSPFARARAQSVTLPSLPREIVSMTWTMPDLYDRYSEVTIAEPLFRQFCGRMADVLVAPQPLPFESADGSI